jgi:hypothetical protein
MVPLSVIFVLSFAFFLCFRAHHRQLSSMREELSKLKVSVQGLENEYSRQLVLGLKSRQFADAQVEGPALVGDLIELNGLNGGR